MGKTLFIDGNPVTKLPGTRVLAAWLNKVFNHRHDGLDKDGSAPLDYALDTGLVDNCVITLEPALTQHIEGLPIWFKVGHNNTGPATLKVNALPAAPLITNAGVPLRANELKAGTIVGVIWQGEAYQLSFFQAPPEPDAQTLSGHTAHQLTPPGAIMAFGMQAAPSGWLVCDGSAVLRAQYADLFTAVGTTWGAGDTQTTFNLPDLRGEFLRGFDNGRGADTGRAFGTWQANGLGAHSHSVHVPTTNESGSGNPWGSGGGGVESASYAFNTDAFGGTETRPRNVSVLYCIKY